MALRLEFCGVLWEAEPGETRTKTVRSCSNPSSSFQAFSFPTHVWSSWVAETGSELELHSFPEGHLHSLSLVYSLAHSCCLLRRELWLLEALSEQADEGHAGTRQLSEPSPMLHCIPIVVAASWSLFPSLVCEAVEERLGPAQCMGAAQ